MTLDYSGTLTPYAIHMYNNGYYLYQYESYSYLTDGHGSHINGINSATIGWYRPYVAFATNRYNLYNNICNR